MTNSALEAFAAHAPEYDATRRRLVPDFDGFYGAAIDALRGLPGPPKRVLDLGAGTGLLSAMVAGAFPDAELVLTDGAAPMLAQAEAFLGARAEYVVADFQDPLPGAGFCAVVSALAIHHLDDAGKRDLFARVHAALKPGGVFVNAEQIHAGTPDAEERAVAWHRGVATANGSDDEEWAGALGRMSHDRCATLEDQLSWLRAAGFTDVAAPYVNVRFAVFTARRARP